MQLRDQPLRFVAAQTTSDTDSPDRRVRFPTGLRHLVHGSG
jgi:hypothetical protein